MNEAETHVDAMSESERTYAPHEAVLEASRCLMCEDPPCNKGCPAGVDVRRFVRKIRFRNATGAIRLIRRANFLAGICGRVCPQEMLCMEECTRAKLDTPIDIAGLQRFAGDIELGTLAPLPAMAEDRPESVAVIGAGPAGLAAACELKKAGFKVDVFDRSDSCGGILSRGIPPFRLDPGFVGTELEYVERLGVGVHLGRVETDVAGLLEEGYAAIFVGSGLGRPYTIGLDGEDLEGVYVAAELLERVADKERPSVGARVVVIGGGNVAVDAAETAFKLGAARVDLCCLESYDEMPAFASEIERARGEGIEFHTRTKPLKILGEGGKVTGYEGIGIRWRQPGLLIPSNAEEIPGTEFGLTANTVIEAIGQGVLDRFEGVDTDEKGLIQVDQETMMTSLPGVFAGGDIVSGGATVVQAVADGKKAAAGIAAYVDAAGGSSAKPDACGPKGGGGAR